MTKFRARRGHGVFEVMAYFIVGNLLLAILNDIMNGYLERNLVVLAGIIYSTICIYYILLDLSLVYEVNDDYLEINCFNGLKKLRIDFKDVNGFLEQDKFINGFKLSGFGKHKYCFGRCVVHNVGLARMFVTCGKKVIYIHTEEISYGLSPEEFEKFKELIISKGIKEESFDVKVNNVREIIKEKGFYVPFIITAIIILAIILIPVILYLTGYMPDNMPLDFDSHFIPCTFGSAKDFVGRQIVYGIMNMILLVCMYYAGHFCAKYDKKLAKRYIYISLAIALVFLGSQIQTLINYF
ncbi:PH domain-containing protein [Clostridium sp. B9]|uniref:PH domain-containing protein n=1 Tax=Clostridium sp. B9 TaxID=3423224 RepID=UPI003D2F487F